MWAAQPEGRTCRAHTWPQSDSMGWEVGTAGRERLTSLPYVRSEGRQGPAYGCWPIHTWAQRNRNKWMEVTYSKMQLKRRENSLPEELEPGMGSELEDLHLSSRSITGSLIHTFKQILNGYQMDQRVWVAVRVHTGRRPWRAKESMLRTLAFPSGATRSH